MDVDESQYPEVECENTPFFFKQLPTEESMIYDEIINIEKKHQNLVSKEISLKILRFLIDFAEISLK